MAACRVQDPVATQPAGDGGGAVVDGGGSSYCEGTGPPLLVGDGITVGGGGGTSGDDVCSGEVAERTFRFALCTCEGYVASTSLTTDSWDSTQGPYVPGGPAGAVGTNGAFASNGVATIGSLWVGGAGGVLLGSTAALAITGDLRDQGGVDGAGATVSVSRDAYVGGDVALAGLTVDGTLTVPLARTIAVSGTQTIGALVRDAVAVPPPCACDPDDLVDIAAFVETYRLANDNATIGLAPDALAAVTADTTLELPCGRFFLTGIGGAAPGGAVTLRITGRVALFVGGDIADLGAAFTVVLDSPDAELDLFVAGLLSSSSQLTLGAADRPARVRLYVGGAGTMSLSGGSFFAGNLYAPQAELALSGSAELYGSLFVRRLATAVPVVIHYDTAVRDAANDCPTAPTTCDSCLDCHNQACVGGMCGACIDDRDCCAPLVCAAGACVP